MSIFCNPFVLIKYHKRTKLVAWSGYQVAKNDYFDKNCVKLKNPCYTRDRADLKRVVRGAPVHTLQDN